jgi:hypothetical protein
MASSATYENQALMLLKITPPLALLWKIYLYENVLFILHYKYLNNLDDQIIIPIPQYLIY